MLSKIITDKTSKEKSSSMYSILLRESWNIVGLNFLLLFGCLSIVLAPQAIIGAAYVCTRMLEDKSVSLWADLRWGAKAVTKQVYILVYLVWLPCVLMCLYAFYIYQQLIVENTMYILALGSAVMCVFLLITVGVVYICALHKDINIKSIKSHLLAILKSIIQSPIVILSINVKIIIWFALHYVLYPISILFILFMSCSLGLMFITKSTITISNYLYRQQRLPTTNVIEK